jgi:hypothetical protein
MAAPARATIRCDSSSRTRLWRRTSRSSLPGGRGTFDPARMRLPTLPRTTSLSRRRPPRSTRSTGTSGTSRTRGGILEDPWAEPPDDAYGLSVAPEQAPDTRPT